MERAHGPSTKKSSNKVKGLSTFNWFCECSKDTLKHAPTCTRTDTRAERDAKRVTHRERRRQRDTCVRITYRQTQKHIAGTASKPTHHERSNQPNNQTSLLPCCSSSDCVAKKHRHRHFEHQTPWDEFEAQVTIKTHDEQVSLFLPARRAPERRQKMQNGVLHQA